MIHRILFLLDLFFECVFFILLIKNVTDFIIRLLKVYCLLNKNFRTMKPSQSTSTTLKTAMSLLKPAVKTPKLSGPMEGQSRNWKRIPFNPDTKYWKFMNKRYDTKHVIHVLSNCPTSPKQFDAIITTVI